MCHVQYVLDGNVLFSLPAEENLSL
jgi:hypothetical protein